MNSAESAGAGGAVRALRPEDESAVRAWLRDYLRQHRDWWADAYGAAPVVPLEDLVSEDWQQLVEASAADDAYVGVLGEEEAVGLVRVHKRTERFMGFEVGVLSWIYVDPSRRGAGVAGILMAAASEWMTAQGVMGRQVYVSVANEGAVKLYRRHGYVIGDYRMLAP